MSQSDIYARLTEELIYNNFDEVSIRERRRDNIEIITLLMSEVGAHLTRPIVKERELMEA